MRKLLVLLVAAAFVFTMALPAMAADEKKVELYGSVRVMTYITDFDKENSGVNFDDSDLVWTLDDGSSRFGARFKAGDIGANVELRPRFRASNGTSTDGSTGMLRQWHATWNFGAGTLLLGQAYGPTFRPICNECLIGGGGFLDGYGDMGGSVREPGMQVWFPIKGLNGMLKLAALSPAEDSNPVVGDIASWAGAGTDTDFTLPQLEASLSMAFGPLDVGFRGLYKTFDFVNTDTDQDVSIDTYLLGIDVAYSMGPFYVKGLAYMAQNLYYMSSAGAPQVNWIYKPASFVATGIDLEDVDNTGWTVAAGFKFSDKVSFEASYGMKMAEQDRLGVDYERDTSALTFLLPITIAKGFTMTPEVVLTDEGEEEIAGVGQGDRGNRAYYGIYWRIDF